MSTDIQPARRVALDRAFQHLGELGAQADLSQATTPLEQWVAVLRHLMKRYGDVGPAPSLDGIRRTPVVAGGVPAEWVQAEHASNAHRLVYFHGGGWAGGTLDDYLGISSTLARLTGSSIAFQRAWRIASPRWNGLLSAGQTPRPTASRTRMRRRRSRSWAIRPAPVWRRPR